MRLVKVITIFIMLVFLGVDFTAEAAIMRPRTHRVTNVVTSASEPVELGNNTVKFTFTGVITTSGPTTVKYRWIRSDGTIAPFREVVFDAAGTKRVIAYWQFGKTDQVRNLWEAIEIVSPNQLTSNQASITVPSLPKVTSVIVSASGPVNIGDNELRYNVTGVITANGPTLVKYIWIRSNGAKVPTIHTIVFNAAGAKNVTDSWQIGKTGQVQNLWETIEILHPNQLMSKQVQIIVPAMK